MLGVVTGLTAEARIAAPLGLARAGGGSPAGAAEAARRLADEGATSLLSFGLAGGLTSDLQPGTIIVPVTILTYAGEYATDTSMTAWLGGAAGRLYAAGAVVATGAAKRALRARTGADAVDLESGAVAVLAASRGLPFAALRAICDPAATDLPQAALVALDARGAIGIVRVASAVLRNPSQLPALLRLARQAAAARRALVRHVATRGEPP